MRTKGKITKWNDDKGFGFITPNAGGKQVFIHISAFNNRSRRPKINQEVTYTLTTDKTGRARAEKATLPGDKLRKKKCAFSIIVAVTFLFIITLFVINGKIPLSLLTIYFVGSIITFVVYAFDKSAAQRGAWRTSESTLHLLSLVGGWPGAIFAQQKLRHKSKKQEFRFVFWITVLLNLGVFSWILTPNGMTTFQSYLTKIISTLSSL
ncbi:DUF1294 domain-containing protein [Thermodesulfobacteriota bacterium B35]